MAGFIKLMASTSKECEQDRWHGDCPTESAVRTMHPWATAAGLGACSDSSFGTIRWLVASLRNGSAGSDRKRPCVRRLSSRSDRNDGALLRMNLSAPSVKPVPPGIRGEGSHDLDYRGSDTCWPAAPAVVLGLATAEFHRARLIPMSAWGEVVDPATDAVGEPAAVAAPSAAPPCLMSGDGAVSGGAMPPMTASAAACQTLASTNDVE